MMIDSSTITRMIGSAPRFAFLHSRRQGKTFALARQLVIALSPTKKPIEVATTGEQSTCRRWVIIADSLSEGQNITASRISRVRFAQAFNNYKQPICEELTKSLVFFCASVCCTG